ncbi:MAG TPA: rod shape-determining protein RodA [Thermodesulfobacteriota bacterium]
MFDRRLLRNFDWFLFFIVILICTIGLVNLFSASYQTGLSVFKKQSVWFVLGIVAAVFISFFDYKTLERYTNHMYVVSMLLLITVLIFGREVSGSKSWISLGDHITLQPSELAKIPIILAIAKFYQSDFEGGPYGIGDLVKPFFLLSLPLVLVMLQPDLGTSLMILLISGSLVVFMGVRFKSITILVILIIGISYPTWHYFLKEYQKERIETFLDPSRDPLGSGYNALQSEIGTGSGKFFGKGFKKGSQTQLRFIPEQHTDFIFSVLAEEWGFIGGFLTLLLYFLLILWIIDTASLAKDRFSMIVSLGIAAIFFWHVLINVGMVTGLLPVLGVPLPLLSYGGSSLLTAMLGVGIVLGIRMRKLPVTREEIAL